jgi:predicted amidohydrolase
VAGSYSKISLWPTEQASLQPGAAVSVFSTAHGIVALAICWDLAFPTLFAQMKAQGAQLVVMPSYWSFTRPAAAVDPVAEGEIDLIDSLCLTRAFENNLAVAYCNAAGDLKAEGLDAVLSGRSQLVHPADKVVVRADGNEETLLVGRIRID